MTHKNKELGIYTKVKKIDGDEYSTTLTKLCKGTTNRGFGLIEFMDKYQQTCSLQDSSSAEEACIWLGVDCTGELIDGPNGKKNEEVGARMHLTQSMVKQLLPYLTEFAKSGEYINNMNFEKPISKNNKIKKE